MLNFYGSFIPNLATELHSLYELLRKDKPFIWTPECQKSFEKSKTLLLNNNILELYDPKKPIVVSCDASPYGVGAVLAHTVNGIEKPVMFASSTLSAAEKNYSQLHREALVIIFGLKKFHKYLFGHRFTIQTDHQPLQTILNPQKGTPAVAAAWLQRWAIILSMYDYQIRYKKATQVRNADALSRLPLEQPTGINYIQICAFNLDDKEPVSLLEIASETNKDVVLRKVHEYLRKGGQLKRH